MAREAKVALGNTPEYMTLLVEVLRQMPAGVVVVEAPSGRIIMGNDQVEEILRHPVQPSGTLEEYVENLSHLDGRPVQRGEGPLTRAIRCGEVVAGEEYTYLRGDGTQAVLSVSAAPIRDPRGQIIAGVITFHDVTDRRQSEKRQVEIARQKDEFLSAVAHDLKTPISSIKGWAQVLQRRASRSEPVDPAYLTRTLDQIDATATKMAVTVNSLLDATRIQMGRPLDLLARPVDLVALARQVATDHWQRTRRHEILVHATVPTLVGRWDAFRLERVLDNLLSNAVKYNPSAGTVTVTIRREDGPIGAWAVLQVHDEGMGIPAEDLPHVFEQFYRARNVASTVPGTGIGLAGVQQIVVEHGGTVSVESQEGAGTTMTVRLPVQR